MYFVNPRVYEATRTIIFHATAMEMKGASQIRFSLSFSSSVPVKARFLPPLDHLLSQNWLLAYLHPSHLQNQKQNQIQMGGGKIVIRSLPSKKKILPDHSASSFF